MALSAIQTLSKQLVPAAVLGLCLALVATPGTAADSGQRFSGSAPGGTPPFKVDGPWLLDWSAASEFPQLAYLELHLYDADNNRFVGVAVRQYGTGSGEKVIREPGRYRIVATGKNVDWSVLVEPAPEDVTQYLQQHPDARRVVLAPPGTGLARTMVAHLTGWQAVGDKALVLKSDDGTTARVGFYGNSACPGLKDSKNIYFVTAGIRGDLYNAIVLENGTRCYLDGVSPER